MGEGANTEVGGTEDGGTEDGDVEGGDTEGWEHREVAVRFRIEARDFSLLQGVAKRFGTHPTSWGCFL